MAVSYHRSNHVRKQAYAAFAAEAELTEDYPLRDAVHRLNKLQADINDCTGASDAALRGMLLAEEAEAGKIILMRAQSLNDVADKAAWLQRELSAGENARRVGLLVASLIQDIEELRSVR